MNRRFLVAFLLVVIAASALAIGRVKVIHAFPTGQVAVDIYILEGNGFVAKSLMNVPYKAASDWFYLPYGEYGLVITATGSSDPLYSTNVVVEEYSTIIFAEDDGELVISAFNDDITSIAPGKARVTIAHRAVGVSGVDVGAGASTTNLASNLGYGSQSDPVIVDAGAVSAGVRPAGNTGAPLLALNVTLEARKHYLVVAVGDAGGTPAPQLVAFELTDYSINARLAFVHGVPANITVDVIANEELTLFRNVQYKGITDYKNIPVGIHEISVVSGPNTPISINAFFNGFSESTLYATLGAEDPKGILLIDNNVAPANGNTRLRVLHGAGSAPSVDVLSGTTVVISNITYGYASEYLSLPANSYSLSVNAAGTSASVFQVNLNLAAGPVITVLATGDPAGSGIEAFTLVVVTDASYGSDGNLRAVHAVAGAPNVNINANGDQILANVPYQAVSDYLPVAAGLYRVSVNAASGNTELFRSPIRVDAAGYFTAVAGGVGEDLALFQLRDDDTRPASGNAHLRVVHSSAGSPEVNIEFAGAVVGSLIYTEAFGYIPVPAGSYIARVLATEGNAQVFNGSLTLEADTVVSVFAVGIVGDNTNGFTVIPAIDFDYRAPMAGPDAAGPSSTATPTRTPTRTPATSSASYVAASSVVLMTLAALL